MNQSDGDQVENNRKSDDKQDHNHDSAFHKRGAVDRSFQIVPLCRGSTISYYGSHIHATYFDSNQTVNVEYRASARDPLVTIGPEIDYKLAKGVRIAVRPGKHFGDNFAAQTAGGFSIDIGVLIDTQNAGIQITKAVKKLAR